MSKSNGFLEVPKPGGLAPLAPPGPSFAGGLAPPGSSIAGGLAPPPAKLGTASATGDCDYFRNRTSIFFPLC